MFCDSVFVEVIIQCDSMEIEILNGIILNGDGLNDVLIFDQLILNLDEYLNNELIVFNCWGDIVFQVQLYGNDWQGENMDGINLFDGIYYFIF